MRKRSINYFLVSGIMVLSVLVLIGLLSLALQHITGQSSPIVAVVTTLVIVAVFRPLQSWIDRYIKGRFLSKQSQYKETIQQAFKILASIIELEELLYAILDTILAALMLEKGIIYLRDKKSDKLYLAAFRDFSSGFGPTDDAGDWEEDSRGLLDIKHPVCSYFEDTGKPLQINSIEQDDEFAQNRDGMIKFFRSDGIVLAVPIIYERNLVGILGLGRKRSEESYSTEDVEIIQTLMMQTAVSIENALKVEELKKMVQLETSYEELQQVNQLKDSFIQMVSHDLRTPMTSIKGYAYLLYQDPSRFDNDTIKEFSKIIVDETDRLTRLITDILDLQKFEAGSVELELEDIDIVALVRQSLNVFKSAANIKKQPLLESIPEQAIMIKGNSDRLKQALANLLSNAIKFTPDGGQIKTYVEHISVNGDTAVRVSISDTGPGISKKDQTHLFQKFYQVDNLVRSSNDGTGLGLALVREIIEYHRGDVGVTSEPGKGSVFYFTIPT